VGIDSAVMAEQATSRQAEPVARGAAEVAELREQLAASREEVLRLRDLLISKDAELGSFKGQVAQLEAGTARLLHLVSRVRALLPEPALQALRLLRSALRRG
jgi:hypothetical protein